MKLPDWRTLVLTQGVLPEQIPEDNRLVLWLPGKRESNVQHWERLSTAARAQVSMALGLCATAATAMRARQRLRGWLGKLWPRPRRAHGKQTWTLPNGESVEQCGERQTDLLLVWAGSDLLALDEARLRSCWPQGQRFQQLGENLFLVAGVQAPSPALAVDQAPPQGCPRHQVEQLLAAARQRGDGRREAAALTDLGVITRREGAAGPAVGLLEEALAIVRQLGDRAGERDVLGNLGLAHLAAGRPQQALTLFGQVLADARAADDRFAEKAALEHLGLAYRNLGLVPQALASFEQALSVARIVNDGPHEADLLWYLAILHAELGQRDQASARAQAAVTRLEELRMPQARWLADHVHKYRLGEGGTSPAGTLASGLGSSPGAVLGTVSVVGSWASPLSRSRLPAAPVCCAWPSPPRKRWPSSSAQGVKPLPPRAGGGSRRARPARTTRGCAAGCVGVLPT